MSARSRLTMVTSASGTSTDRLGIALGRLAALGEQAQRIEGRDVGGIDAGRQRQARGQPHEGAHLDDLAIADALGHRRAHGMAGREHRLIGDELVALAGAAAGAGGRGGAGRHQSRAARDSWCRRASRRGSPRPAGPRRRSRPACRRRASAARRRGDPATCGCAPSGWIGGSMPRSTSSAAASGASGSAGRSKSGCAFIAGRLRPPSASP